MFIDLKDHPRENGPTLGDERTTLVEANDPLNQHGSGGGPVSLRFVLVGLVEEHAAAWAMSTCCASGWTHHGCHRSQ
jgi:hypothetical protein